MIPKSTNKSDTRKRKIRTLQRADGRLRKFQINIASRYILYIVTGKDGTQKTDNNGGRGMDVTVIRGPTEHIFVLLKNTHSSVSFLFRI